MCRVVTQKLGTGTRDWQAVVPPGPLATELAPAHAIFVVRDHRREGVEAASAWSGAATMSKPETMVDCILHWMTQRFLPGLGRLTRNGLGWLGRQRRSSKACGELKAPSHGATNSETHNESKKRKVWACAAEKMNDHYN